MNQNDIELALVKAVCRIHEISGREPIPVTIETIPLADMPDFDSLNGVEATVEILEELNTEADFNNIFVDNNVPLTIGQAAARLLNCLRK
jgi:hydroxypyruvate isomerase